MLLIGSGATVKWFGSSSYPAWTRLASTASKGAHSAVLESVPSGWKVGDTIVIASTDFNATHSEERILTSISGKCFICLTYF